jgi:LPXTG-motif cell wall-anchored protein
MVRERTGNFDAPIVLIAGILLLAAALVSYIRRMFFRDAPVLRSS